MKTLVFNTSSSLFLVKIGLIPKILQHFRVITSPEIEKEMKQGAELGYKDATMIAQFIAEQKIKVVDTRTSREMAKNFNLKEVDASVVALAQERSAIAATEDKQIEKICIATATPVVNTAVLLYTLWKEQELKSEQAYVLLDLLLRQGYNKEICLKIKEKIMEES